MNNILDFKIKHLLTLISVFFISCSFVLGGDTKSKVKDTYLAQTEYSLRQLLDNSNKIEATICLEHLQDALLIAFKIAEKSTSQSDLAAYRNELSKMVTACSSQGFITDGQTIVMLSEESLSNIRIAIQTLKSITVAGRQQSFDKINVVINLVNKVLADHTVTVSSHHRTPGEDHDSTSDESSSHFTGTTPDAHKQDGSSTFDNQQVPESTSSSQNPGEEDTITIIVPNETPGEAPDIIVIDLNQFNATQESDFSNTTSTSSSSDEFGNPDDNSHSTEQSIQDAKTTGVYEVVKGFTYINGTTVLQFLKDNPEYTISGGLFAGLVATAIASPITIIAILVKVGLITINFGAL